MGQQKEDSGKKGKLELSFYLCQGGQEMKAVLGTHRDEPSVSREFYHERHFPLEWSPLGLSDTTVVFRAPAPAFEFFHP